MIHSTAIIHPSAQIDPTCRIGPYAVIDAHVAIGAECVIGPHVHLTGHTQIGARNQFHAGCVIGDAPQDLKYRDEPTRLIIGDNNVFREHATVHRANKVAEDTVIGSNNFLMAHCHVGHNCRLDNFIIIANGALLGGHVTVEDRVFISGNCLAHQFVRLGRLALMQGGSAVSKDLPPFTIGRGDNRICGLNIIGLRRAGYSREDRLDLKRLYRMLFRQNGNIRKAAENARPHFASAAALGLIDFILQSKRGVCGHAGGKLEEGED